MYAYNIYFIYKREHTFKAGQFMNANNSNNFNHKLSIF